jgi:DNA-binding response OmpR family regulator
MVTQQHTTELELLLFSENVRELIQVRGMLEAQGAVVKDARDLASAWDWMLARRSPPAAVLINLTDDVLTESSPAIHFYRVIRKGLSNLATGERFGGWGDDLPVVFLLPHQGLVAIEDQLVTRLGVFADQYQTKPYNPSLEYRKLVNLVSRRNRATPAVAHRMNEGTLKAGRIMLSPQQLKVIIDNSAAVELSDRELQLLRILLDAYARKQEYVSYEELGRSVLDLEMTEYTEESIISTLRTHKYNLMQKIGACSRKIAIKTARGKGYRLIQDDDTTWMRAVAHAHPSLTFVGTTQQFDDSSAVYTSSHFLRQTITTIGRQESDLLIPMQQISRQHAKIVEVAEGRWCLSDVGTDGLGSTHGTVIIRAGERKSIRQGRGCEDAHAIELEDGDLIEFGEAVVYRFSLSQQASPRPRHAG